MQEELRDIPGFEGRFPNMNYNEWLAAYTKLTNKLNKKKPLTTEEIDELLDIIEKTRNFINQSEYEVMKRQ